VADRIVRALVAVEGVEAFDVQQALPEDPSFQLVGMSRGVDDTLRQLDDSSPDVLLIACTGEGDRALQMIDAAYRTAPDTPVVVLPSTSPNGFLRRAFEAGAADVVPFETVHDQLRFALSKAIARRGRGGVSGDGSRSGELVCVLGPKGGTGKTLTACNLAVAIAEGGLRVLVVDLDLQFGDVALTMGLPPDRTIYDLALSGGSLDETKMSDFVLRHASGVDVLLAPSRPDQASAVSIDLLRDVYAIARRQYDAVIVDTPPGFTAEVIATIDASSALVMVGMLDSLSLKNTKLGLETLTLMDYDPTHIRLVLNRAKSRVGISEGDVVAVLGREPDVYVPSDREIPKAVNEGVPIVVARPQSEPAAAFRTLAGIVAGVSVHGSGDEPHGASAPRRRLFGRKS
jgi:pilus assembly protein CpaE